MIEHSPRSTAANLRAGFAGKRNAHWPAASNRVHRALRMSSREKMSEKASVMVWTIATKNGSRSHRPSIPVRQYFVLPEQLMVMWMSEIAGKVVAITGASSGIGAASARLLAARGAKLVLG